MYRPSVSQHCDIKRNFIWNQKYLTLTDYASNRKRRKVCINVCARRHEDGDRGVRVEVVRSLRCPRICTTDVAKSINLIDD